MAAKNNGGLAPRPFPMSRGRRLQGHFFLPELNSEALTHSILLLQVVVQVQQVVPHGSLDARRVHIPGMLVDMVVVAGQGHCVWGSVQAEAGMDC